MVFFVYAAADDQALSVINDVSEYSLIWIIVGMLAVTALTLNKKNTSFSVWYLVTWLSFTRMLVAVNISIDSSSFLFFTKIVKGLNGYQIINNSESPSKINNFYSLGYTTYSFVNNTEKFLIVFFACFGLYLIFLVFAKCSSKIREFRERVGLDLMIRAVLVCCFDFFLFGFLQLYHISMDGVYNIISVILAVLLVVVCAICVVYFPIYINGEARSKEEVHRNTLLFEFKFKEPLKGYYYFVFILNRLISSVFFVFFSWTPEVQVVVIGLCILAQVIYTIKFRPFRENIANYLTVACESFQLIILSCISCHLTSLSSAITLCLRWLILSCFWLAILACFFRFLFQILKKNPPDQVQDSKSELKVEPVDLLCVPKDEMKISSKASSRHDYKIKIQSDDQLADSKQSQRVSERPGLLIAGSKQSGRMSDRPDQIIISSKQSERTGSRALKQSKKGEVKQDPLPVVEDLDENEEDEHKYYGISYYGKLLRKHLKNANME